MVIAARIGWVWLRVAGMARCGRAWLGRAGQGAVLQARHGVAWQALVGRGAARLGKVFYEGLRMKLILIAAIVAAVGTLVAWFIQDDWRHYWTRQRYEKRLDEAEKRLQEREKGGEPMT